MITAIAARPPEDTEAASEAGRALNAQRRIVARTCGVCSREFIGLITRKWCDSRCAKRAERARKKTRKAKVSRFLRYSNENPV